MIEEREFTSSIWHIVPKVNNSPYSTSEQKAFQKEPSITLFNVLRAILGMKEFKGAVE